MRVKFKAVDPFDKKSYYISKIDFNNKKITILFRGTLENYYDFDDLKIIQTTEMFDINKNEVFEADLITDGLTTYLVFYDKSKGGYYGKSKVKEDQIEPLYVLLEKGFLVQGSSYLQ
ncbi:MAG: hypothetical protein ACE3JP_04375 [Ectobacillus sp.]